MGEWDGGSAPIPRLLSKYELGLSLYHVIVDFKPRRKENRYAAPSGVFSVFHTKPVGVDGN